MSTSSDYYSLLGVFRDATQDEIKRAYFEAAQRLHPDKNEAPGETEIFLDVQQAYDTLSSPEKRAAYDATLAPEDELIHPIVERISFSRESLVRLSESQLIYALLEWKPRQSENELNTPPLNVCLVLDRSTSMKGEKMDMVKLLYHRAISIDTRNKSVTALDMESDTTKSVPYDCVIIATGSRPFVPPIPGAHELLNKGVFIISNPENAKQIIDYSKGISSAVVVGAGAIGLEVLFGGGG